MSRNAEVAAILLGLSGILWGWVAASYAYVYFVDNGVASDYATGYSVIVALAVLGVFLLIAFKVRRRKVTPTPKMHASQLIQTCTD